MIAGLFAAFFYLMSKFYLLLFKAMFLVLKFAFTAFVGAARLIACAGVVAYRALTGKSKEEKQREIIACHASTLEIVEEERYAFAPSSTMDSLADGYEFEEYVARLMRKNGFYRVRTTPKSGDYGADVLAVKDGKRYAVQCKLYKAPVGPKAVQEIYAGGRYYNCDVCVVATNNFYTLSAISLAEKTGVFLWDGSALSEMERTVV